MTGTSTDELIARSSAVSKPDPVPSRSIEVTQELAGAELDRPQRPGERVDDPSADGRPGRRPPSGRPLPACASIATTTAWRPNRSAQSPDQSRVGDGRRVQRDLVGPGPQHIAHLVDAPDAAADGQRDERPPGGPFDDVEERAAPLRGGGDVEEDELVGAFAGVPLGQLGRIALVDQVDEAGAFDDAAVGHVEAWDHASTEHQAARTRSTKLASRRRPSAPLRSGWNWTPTIGPRGRRR